MGCLFEFIFDVFIDGWFDLMLLIGPEKWSSKRLQIFLKIIVVIITCLLFIVMFLGVFALISDDEYTKTIGRYMVYIPLAISLVQILLGITLRIIAKKYK